MHPSNRSRIIPSAFTLAIITISLAVATHAQTFTTLASFNGSDGSNGSYGPLVQGTDGNYYGTTQGGGKNFGGVFFRVTPAGNLSDLYNFCHSALNCSDGRGPWSSPVLATDGNFYGTTNVGGNTHHGGTIYKITPQGVLTTLYTFCPTSACEGGKYPLVLMQASNGNFYGITANFGPDNNGTIFEFTSAGAFKVLYSFCPQFNCANGGSAPRAPLMQARNGNLYGTTTGGGAYGNGTVFEISLAGTFRTIHDFCSQSLCPDGSSPYAGLVEDAHGNFYGTTFYGGANSFGTVFEITSAGEYVVLHSFDNADGCCSTSPPTLASDGNLYGVTSNSTTFGGTIYEITAAHQFRLLASFCSPSVCSGANPYGNLFQATNGIFYGTTYSGGTSNQGTVFSLSTGLSPLVETVPIAAKVGTKVVILGNHLTGATAVAFNGTAASFTVVSDTEIKATVPSGATTGKITVTTPTHTFRSNPAFQVLP